MALPKSYTFSELYAAVRGMDIKSMTSEEIRALKALMKLKEQQLEEALASRVRT